MSPYQIFVFLSLVRVFSTLPLAKQEHTEQIKIENTELRLRVNELETNMHDLQLKYDEMRQTERTKAKEDIDKLTKEKSLELEVIQQQLQVHTTIYLSSP